MYILLDSYLKERHFFIRYGESVTNIFPLKAGVPQGSVLGPILYTLFTADFPTNIDTQTATFADDIAVLVKDEDLQIATRTLVTSLDEIEQWANKLRVKFNEEKSVNVIFTKCHNDTQHERKRNPKVRQCEVSRTALGQTPDMEKTHNDKKKTTWPETEVILLATWKKISVIPV